MIVNRFYIVILLLFATTALIYSQNKKTPVSGRVFTETAGEPVFNCNVSVEGTLYGTVTDSSGYFELSLPQGKFYLVFSYVGYKSLRRHVDLSSGPGRIDLSVYLTPSPILQEEVTVVSEKKESPLVLQEIESGEIKKMPTIYGDVLRSVKILSGVTTNNELSSGYNVRGGTYDENLIYLNGYEIYRPFLLRNGIEESQSLINPDMVDNLNFYNGAFSSRFGDRMSSALEVNYYDTATQNLTGSVRADLLNMGLNLRKKAGPLNFNLGARYAYPAAFLRELQTRGDYKPSYSDIQFLADYTVNDKTEIDFFGLYSINEFNLNPDDWEGHFGGLSRGDYRGLLIDYTGERNYKYTTGLLAVRLKRNIDQRLNLMVSAARYWTAEDEDQNITGDLYYLPDPGDPEASREYLKTRDEFADNSIRLNSYRLKAELGYDLSDHSIILGAEYRFDYLTNYVDEYFFETGDSSISERPIVTNFSNEYQLNSIGIYIEDNFRLLDNLILNAGLRYFHYRYSDEDLFSPRISLFYNPSPANAFKISWGFYYQPPFINELRNIGNAELKSQRAIHYIAGWNTKLNMKLDFKIEAYYKRLDDLIPFYIDDLKTVYTGSNEREGYSYGIDAMLQGEIVEGMRSWIGYSYLNSKERNLENTADYQRRLLDQTHTIQIFLQDKMPKHPNWQSHLRFLLGSGYLYYNRIIENDPVTGLSYIEVDINDPREFFLFLRVDMGLSASFDISNYGKLLVIGEVLNVFNHYNISGYEWVQVWKGVRYPFRIPQVLSKRFFNIRLEYNF